MTEYWKSVGNYYCDYCKVFVRNDAFSRRQHEGSPRHEGALKRQVRDIHRKNEREARDLAQVNRELARIGGKTAPPKKSVEQQVKKPHRVKKEKRVETLDDGQVYRAALAQHAMPGEWTSVQSDKTPEEEEDSIRSSFPDALHENDKASITDIKPAEPIDEVKTSGVAKRRHDGADEELLGFRVEQKKDILHEADAGDDVPVVSFKKKKKKAGAA